VFISLLSGTIKKLGNEVLVVDYCLKESSLVKN